MKTEINSLIVKKYGLDAGASVVGIVASMDFNFAPDGFKPSDVLDGCFSVIVLGVPFPKDALKSTGEYTEYRKVIIEKMSSIVKEVAKRVKGNGYKALTVSGCGSKFIDGKPYGHISLKHAAELAGLGLINRNYLLTNDQYGNLLWFGAVLTDADLIADKKAQYKVCDNCNKCIETCPSGALNNPVLFGYKECNKVCFKLANNKMENELFFMSYSMPILFWQITKMPK